MAASLRALPLLTLLLGGVFALRANAVPAWPADSLPPDSAATDEPPAVRRLVAYLEANLNTLGDPDVPTADKDVIIRSSYAKLFRDADVQIEDDLDTARQVVTYKPVQAYLQDVEFFFRRARFRYEILEVSPQTADDGRASWKVRTLRTLRAVDFRGDTLRHDQERFVEINDTDAGLQVVSVYTTKPDPARARRAWWAALDADWKQRLAGETRLTPTLRLADVDAFGPGWLRAADRAYALPGAVWPSAGPGLWRLGTDTVDAPPTDTLPMGLAELDAFLAGLVGLRRLDLRGFAPTDWRPLDELRQLEELDLSDAALPDAGPLRALVRLRRLDLSGTGVADLTPLRFARDLRTLRVRNGALRGALPPWERLEALDRAGCPLSPEWAPPASAALHRLDLSGSGLQRLDRWPPLPALAHVDLSGTAVADWSPARWPTLETLDAHRTPVADLTPAAGWMGLRRLGIDGTAVADLGPLAGLPALERVDADGSLVSDAAVRAFHRVQPEVLVVHETRYLERWWEGLDAGWREALAAAAGLSRSAVRTPDAEALHRITSLRYLDLRGRTDIRDLRPLGELPELERLYLADLPLAPPPPRAAADSLPPPVDAAGWATMERLGALRELDLSGLPLEELPFLAGADALRRLALDRTPLRDPSALHGLGRLEVVLADSTALSDSAAAVWHREAPELLLVYRSAALDRWWDGLSPAWRAALGQALALVPGAPGSGLPAEGRPDRETLARLVRIPRLDLEGLGIGDLSPLVELDRLEELRCAGNAIRDLRPLRHTPLLRVLDAARNPLESLQGVGGCSALRTLEVSDTPIRDLDPVAALGRLEELRAAGTEIRDLGPLAGLRRLRVLDVANTRVRSLSDLDAVASLEEVVAFNTNLSEGRAARFRETHPACRLTWY